MNKNVIFVSIFLLAVIGGVFLISNLNNDENNKSIRGKNSELTKPTDKKIEIEKYTENNVVNFYLENSGSIDGYLNSNSEFKQAINQILRNLEVDNFDFNTYYINTNVYPSNKGLDSFLNDLKVEGYRVGDRSTSNINLMFYEAIRATENGSISILVSDGIYSLETLNSSELIEALDSEKLNTRNKVVSAIQNRNLMTIVVKMNSMFKGVYYKANQTSEKINQQRPYYIWIFGNPDNVNEVLNSIDLEIINGYVNSAKFFITSTLQSRYSILTSGSNKIGTFKKLGHDSSIDVHEIVDCRKSERASNSGKFGFTIAVDLSNLQVPNSYKLDINNYLINNVNYKIEDIKHISEINESIKIAVARLSFEPTHIISLYSSTSHLGEFDLELLNNLPGWIEESNNYDDNVIVGDTYTTFGFSPLMQGISLAYEKLNERKEYLDFNLKVKL